MQVIVCNSIFGKQDTHLTDIPIFYARTGLGYQVNREVKFCLQKCKEKLKSYGMKVFCFSGDTAFHKLTHVRNDGSSNNIVGILYEEMGKWKNDPEAALSKLNEYLPKPNFSWDNISIPYSWTWKKSETDWSEVLEDKFPDLGDFETDEIWNVLNSKTNHEYIPNSTLDVFPEDNEPPHEFGDEGDVISIFTQTKVNILILN